MVHVPAPMPALKREDSRDSLLALVTLVTNTGGPLALTESALRSKPFAFLSFLTPMLVASSIVIPST